VVAQGVAQDKGVVEMKRRGFLKTIGAALALPLVGRAAEAEAVEHEETERPPGANEQMVAKMREIRGKMRVEWSNAASGTTEVKASTFSNADDHYFAYDPGYWPQRVVDELRPDTEKALNTNTAFGQFMREKWLPRDVIEDENLRSPFVGYIIDDKDDV
jgi:hypothetical protein